MKKTILAPIIIALFLIITQPLSAQCTTGDVNLDGSVGISDFSIMVQVLTCGDMNGNGRIDGCDAADILAAGGFPLANGDVDLDGTLGLADVTAIFNYYYGTGTLPPTFCCCLADVNCDGFVDSLDGTYLADYLFNNGPAPCATPACPTSCP